MPTIYLDGETTYNKHVTLKRLSLRNYLARADLLGMAFAQDDEDPVFFSPDEIPAILPDLKRMAEDPTYTFVAHNWSFDGRLLVLKLGLPYPAHARCSLEAAMCAFPNHPGGYSLENLGATLNLSSGVKNDKATEVLKMTPERLAAYCCQDVRLCRDVYQAALQMVHPDEWAVAESCSRAKQCYFLVDQEAVGKAVEGFAKLADAEALELVKVLSDKPDQVTLDKEQEVAGLEDDGHVRSLRPATIKRLLVENLAFDTPTIRKAAINPVELAAHEQAAKAIDHSSKANSALSSKRRVRVFQGAEVIDAELNWYAAHTGRSASRAVGKGLNLLNLPKHNKEVAKLIRSMFKLPSEYCFVRADEMNVEYRCNCLLSRCAYGCNLFVMDRMCDPYSAFGLAATGVPVKKGDPARQLWKAAILGLGYLMGLEKWCRELLRLLANPKSGVTIKNMQAACEANGWQFPRGKMSCNLQRKLGCDPSVIAVGFHVRELFHARHPEFRQFADWLYRVAEEVSAGAGQAVIDSMYDGRPGCPDPDMVRAEVVTDQWEGPSVRWYLAGWPAPTVLWRDLGIRDVNGKIGLTVMSGRKGYRSFYQSIAIENIIQSASRNRTCLAKLELAERGYPYVFDVHDELLPVVLRDVDSVLKAKQDLLEVLGPNRPDPWGWACTINPHEINVSQSWYEVAVGNLLPPVGANEKGEPIYPPDSEWWKLLPSTPSLLENLP